MMVLVKKKKRKANRYLCRYHIRNGVMYLALCEKAYPKKLALAFLEELTQEFEVLHGDKIQSVERPYAFIAFGE